MVDAFASRSRMDCLLGCLTSLLDGAHFVEHFQESFLFNFLLEGFFGSQLVSHAVLADPHCLLLLSNLLLFEAELLVERVLRFNQAGHDFPLEIFLFGCVLAPHLLLNFEVLSVPFKGFFQLTVLLILFFLSHLDSQPLFLTGISENFGCSFTRLHGAFSPTFRLDLMATFDLLFEVVSFEFAFLSDLLLHLGLLFSHLFLPLLDILDHFVTIFGHSLLQLCLVELFRHLTIQHELLVERVPQHNVRRQGRFCQLLGEAHLSWQASSRTSYKLASPGAASGATYHLVEVLDRDLLSFEVIQEALSDCLFDLLRVIAALPFVVVHPHLCDLLSDAWPFEVLQGPTNQEVSFSYCKK